MSLSKSTTLNYSNVFYSCFANNDFVCHDKATSHFLIYVYSGEMLLMEKGNEQFKSISLKFNKEFLRRYYQKLYSHNLPQTVKPLKSSVVKLPQTPSLESLFLSMKPYFESDTKPQEELIEMKMQEGIMSLLDINKSFYPALFDFTEPWKIDI